MYSKNYKNTKKQNTNTVLKKNEGERHISSHFKITGKAIKSQYSDIDIMYNKQTS